MVVEPVGGDVGYHLPTWQHEVETVSVFTIKYDLVLPCGMVEGEYVCYCIGLTEHPSIDVEVGGVFQIPRHRIDVQDDGVGLPPNVGHHVLV